MFTRPLTIIGAAFVAIYTSDVVVDWAYREPDPDAPLVELIDLRWDAETQKIIYERRVNISGVVTAPWSGSIISATTERHVPECEVKGRSPYGSKEIEPETQRFAFDRFYDPPACREALQCGESYYMTATVAPPVGRASAITSLPFEWTCP